MAKTCYFPVYTFRDGDTTIDIKFNDFTDYINRDLDIRAIRNLPGVSDEAIAAIKYEIKKTFSICCDEPNLHQKIISNKEKLKEIIRLISFYQNPNISLYNVICLILQQRRTTNTEYVTPFRGVGIGGVPTDTALVPANPEVLKLESIRLVRLVGAGVAKYCSCDKPIEEANAEFYNNIISPIFTAICSAAAENVAPQDPAIPQEPDPEDPNPPIMEDSGDSTEETMTDEGDMLGRDAITTLQYETLQLRDSCGKNITLNIETAKNQSDLNFFNKRFLKTNILDQIKKTKNGDEYPLIETQLNTIQNKLRANVANDQKTFINRLNNNSDIIVGRLGGYSVLDNRVLASNAGDPSVEGGPPVLDQNKAKKITTANKYYGPAQQQYIKLFTGPLNTKGAPKIPDILDVDSPFPRYITVSFFDMYKDASSKISQNMFIPGSIETKMPLLKYIDDDTVARGHVSTQIPYQLIGNILIVQSSDILKFGELRLQEVIKVPTQSFYIPIDLKISVEGLLTFKPKCYPNKPGPTEEETEKCNQINEQQGLRSRLKMKTDDGQEIDAVSKTVAIQPTTLGTFRIIIKVKNTVDYQIIRDGIEFEGKKYGALKKGEPQKVLSEVDINTLVTDSLNTQFGAQNIDMGSLELLYGSADNPSGLSGFVFINKILNQQFDGRNNSGSGDSLGLFRAKNLRFPREDILNIMKYLRTLNANCGLSPQITDLAMNQNFVVYADTIAEGNNISTNASFVLVSYDGTAVYARELGGNIEFEKNVNDYYKRINSITSPDRANCPWLNRAENAALSRKILNLQIQLKPDGSGEVDVTPNRKIYSYSELECLYKRQDADFFQQLKNKIVGDKPDFDIFEDISKSQVIVDGNDRLNIVQLKFDDKTKEDIQKILETKVFLKDDDGTYGCCCCNYELMPIGTDENLKYTFEIISVGELLTDEEIKKFESNTPEPIPQNPVPQPQPGQGEPVLPVEEEQQ